MCDYSLCGLPNRLAVEGEELVVHRFRTGSLGLTSPLDLAPRAQHALRPAGQNFWRTLKSFLFDPAPSWPSVTAVCIPPGAQLLIKNLPRDLCTEWHVEEEELVCFVQASANVNTYRDAVRFRNGTQVLLQSMREGIRAQVLALDRVTTKTDRVTTEKDRLTTQEAGRQDSVFAL